MDGSLSLCNRRLKATGCILLTVYSYLDLYKLTEYPCQLNHHPVGTLLLFVNEYLNSVSSLRASGWSLDVNSEYEFNETFSVC